MTSISYECNMLFIHQFLLFMFLFEASLKLVWFPLEKNVMELPQKISDAIDLISSAISIKLRFLESFQENLQSSGAKIFSSYFSSLILLLSTSQFVEILDLRIIVQDSFVCFLNDIVQRNFCVDSNNCCSSTPRRRRSKNTRSCSMPYGLDDNDNDNFD